MKKITTILLFTGFLFQTSTSFSQAILDSLLLDRKLMKDDYTEFRDHMNERTWINLVTIQEKANDLLEVDNKIINNYLERELRKKKEYRDSIEKLNLDIALLTKENEVQQMILDEKSFLNRTLLIIIGSVSLFFFVLLILYIDRQSRFRAARLELERYWNTGHDAESKSLQKDEINTLREQLYKTSDEIEKLKKENKSAQSMKELAENKLREEIADRRKAEQEIQQLIEQLKSL
ncbi:MAG: hypothetical protein KDC05_08630 [Bacteroidales bacterium]|nr:hypothetical protein [Bacteroidales bacterium]